MNKITGYRELSVDEVDLINDIKRHGVALNELVDRLRATRPFDPTNPIPIDGRWVSIGVTHLQEGLMALTRAVARPSTF